MVYLDNNAPATLTETDDTSKKLQNEKECPYKIVKVQPKTVTLKDNVILSIVSIDRISIAQREAKLFRPQPPPLPYSTPPSPPPHSPPPPPPPLPPPVDDENDETDQMASRALKNDPNEYSAQNVEIDTDRVDPHWDNAGEYVVDKIVDQTVKEKKNTLPCTKSTDMQPVAIPPNWPMIYLTTSSGGTGKYVTVLGVPISEPCGLELREERKCKR